MGFPRVTLVKLRTEPGLVVHHELHTYGAGILVEGFDVKVGIGGNEVKHIVLRLARTSLPSLRSAFDKHLVKTVLDGKVDVRRTFSLLALWRPLGLVLV